MSRIGRKPIVLPENVSVDATPSKLVVKGALAEITVVLPHSIKVVHKDNRLTVDNVSQSKASRALHGTISRLIANAVKGVSEGFEKKLELVGIGYRASVADNEIILQVGFTHPVRVKVPEGLTARVDRNVITVFGADKQQVGQFAAELRSIRKPEPYKGKGIRYQGERVRMKQGKAVKATTAS